MYQGSQARVLTEMQNEQLNAPRLRPDFQVHQGAGIDSQVREGVSSRYVNIAKVALAVFSFVMILGIARVAITSATVQAMAQANSLRSDIEQAQVLEGNLRVEESVLSRGTRINEIATTQYGMVVANQTETMSLH